MDVKVVTGDITRIRVDAIIVNLFEGVKRPGGATGAVDKALDGAVTELIKQGEIKGKLYEVTIVHTLGKIPARVVAVVGLGKQADFNVDKIRRVMAQACRSLRRLNHQRVATILHGTGAGGVDTGVAAQAIVEGTILGLYGFRKHITKEPEYKDVAELLVVERDTANKRKLEQSCYKGKVLAEATNLARDLVNEPANYMTPTDMAKVAERLAKAHGLGLVVLDRDQMKKMGFDYTCVGRAKIETSS